MHALKQDQVPSLVSVIIPAYNRRDLIIETLDSVAAQTYRPIELIVVDDGSTDGTGHAVVAWFQALNDAQRDGLSLNIVRRTNGGQQRARNSGLAEARGEFIQFLDSDDILHPEKISLHVKKLRVDRSLDCVYSALTSFISDIDWNVSPHPKCAHHGDLVSHLVDNPLNTNLGLYRRSICDKVGGWNEKINKWTDVEFVLRIIQSGGKVGHVPGVYVGFRDHAEPRASRPKSAVPSLEGMRAIAEIVADVSKSRSRIGCCLADHFWRIGLTASCNGEFEIAREALAEAAKYWAPRTRMVKIRMLSFLATMEADPAIRRQIATWIYIMAGTKSRQHQRIARLLKSRAR